MTRIAAGGLVPVIKGEKVIWEKEEEEQEEEEGRQSVRVTW